MNKQEPRTPLPWTRKTIIWLALAEDVDFAVRACNSHDDLLAALEAAPPPPLGVSLKFPRAYTIWFRKARAAIAKAKEKAS